MDHEVRRNVNISEKNQYIFASTNKSENHVAGWHCINEMLTRAGIARSFNATQNRHRVATLLAQMSLNDKEKDLLFKHFGHSKHVNENVYQAAAGTMQVNTTGRMLLQVNYSLLAIS